MTTITTTAAAGAIITLSRAEAAHFAAGLTAALGSDAPIELNIRLHEGSANLGVTGRTVTHISGEGVRVAFQ